jgi:recombination protein RecA
MKEADRERTIRQKLCRMDEAPVRAVPPIPAGYPEIEEALGGGWPRGRVVEFFGSDGCGKTTVVLRSIAAAQRMGLGAALVDAEHAFDPRYAAGLGVDLGRLVVVRPEWGEQALEIACQLTASGAIDLVVVDSAAALVPKLELDNSLESAAHGLVAGLLTRALRKLTPLAARHDVCVLFVNQLRSGADGQETTAGGPALRAFASVRAELRATGPGGRVHFRVVKSKAEAGSGEADLQLGLPDEGCGQR